MVRPVPLPGHDVALASLLVREGRFEVGALRELLQETLAARTRGELLNLAGLLVQRGLIGHDELRACYERLAQPGSLGPEPLLESASARGWRPGARVDDFLLEERLGAGGMGVVFAARHVQTGARCAIKALLPGADSDLLQRFSREALAHARVDGHPAVLRLHGAGRALGRPYVVMELAKGGDLEERLRRGGPLSPDDARGLIGQLAGAVAHLHGLGILHRDLKPQNVLFDEAGRPRLTDFGLVSVTGAQSLTESGTLLGTPSYMAPEQAEARELDARTDVYGLGALLYACLTGRPPFQGPLIQVLAAVCSERPPPPSSHVPGIPAELEAICQRAMERDPAERFQSARELQAALGGGRLATWSSRWLLALLGAALLLLLLAGAFASGWGRGAARSPAAEPTSSPPSPPASQPPEKVTKATPRRPPPKLPRTPSTHRIQGGFELRALGARTFLLLRAGFDGRLVAELLVLGPLGVKRKSLGEAEAIIGAGSCVEGLQFSLDPERATRLTHAQPVARPFLVTHPSGMGYLSPKGRWAGYWAASDEKLHVYQRVDRGLTRAFTRSIPESEFGGGKHLFALTEDYLLLRPLLPPKGRASALEVLTLAAPEALPRQVSIKGDLRVSLAQEGNRAIVGGMAGAVWEIDLARAEVARTFPPVRTQREGEQGVSEGLARRVRRLSVPSPEFLLASIAVSDATPAEIVVWRRKPRGAPDGEARLLLRLDQLTDEITAFDLDLEDGWLGLLVSGREVRFLPIDDDLRLEAQGKRRKAR